MGDKLGNATYIDRLLMSQALSAPNFSLIGNGDYFSCHVKLASKSGKKSEFWYFWVFADIYLGEIESVFLKVKKCSYKFFFCISNNTSGSSLPNF